MIWRRGILIGLLTVTALALQTSIFSQATLAGTKPPLILLVVVALAIGEGAVVGMVAGFVGGLAVDSLGGGAGGVTALAYTVVGYTVGALRSHLQLPSVWLPIAVVASATAAGVLLTAGVSAFFGGPVGAGSAARHAALGACYNGLLTPFVFPAVRALAVRLRPVSAVARGVRP